MNLSDSCRVFGAVLNMLWAYPLSLLVNKYIEWYVEVNAGKILVNSVIDIFERNTTQLEYLANMGQFVLYGYIIVSAFYMVAIPMKNKLMAVPMAFASLGNLAFMTLFLNEYYRRHAHEMVKTDNDTATIFLTLLLAGFLALSTLIDVFAFLTMKQDSRSSSDTFLSGP